MEMNSVNEMNLLYTMDDAYAMQAGVSMVSLFLHNPDISFHLYIISDRISGDNLERLKRLAEEYAHKIDIIEMPDIEKKTGVRFATNGWYLAAYCRLFLCELIPEETDKLLYMDPDTLVTGSIRELADIMASEEFENCPLAAALDSKAAFKRFHGFGKNEKYYNDGVMLINAGWWRKYSIQKIIYDEIRRRDGRSIDVDQSYINCILINKIMTLPIKYNVMPVYYKSYEDYLKLSGYRPEEIYTREEIRAATDKPVIIHFAGDAKYRPWYKDCRHSMRDAWMEQLGKTEWSSFIPAEMAPEEESSFMAGIKSKTVKSLIHIRSFAKLYVKYKYGFEVKLFREGKQ